MGLLRTDSVSTLAALWFLYRFCQFYGGTIREEKTKHYADNLTLMWRVQWAPKRITTTPGEYTKADFSIQLKIRNTLKQMGLSLNSNHMKGH
eukprot:3325348-Ditylum_brightwellii.AAC.1